MDSYRHRVLALLESINRGIADLHCALGRLNRAEGDLMATIQDIQTAVAANTTVQQSAITLLQGLKAALDAAVATGDPAAIQAVVDELGARTTELAQAVTANTPAATQP